MSDILDENGLTLQTLTDIVAGLESDLKAIYGSDINIDPDSPDGQAINIFAQAAIDLREVLQSIYSSMDPAQASGTVLDQRVALNGIKRNSGTFTVIPVDITVSGAVNLVGLDALSDSIDIPSGVYTVKDNAGTQWVLLASVALSAGTTALDFRAVNMGAVTATVGTITTPVTVVAGVTAINNSSSVSVQGVDEETDSQLRARRERSISNAATGFLDAIQGNLESIDNVIKAVVYENVTDVTDVDGIPPHSIWAIIQGGLNADIAAMLYAKKSAGAGFYGLITENVTRPNGSLYPVKFDRPIDANLWIQFGLSLPDGIIDTTAIKVSIVDNIVWNLGEDALADVITSYVKGLNSKYRITGMQLSADGITYSEIVSAPSKAGQFIMAVSRISIT